jgi:sarcosine oxidase subunit beta
LVTVPGTVTTVPRGAHERAETLTRVTRLRELRRSRAGAHEDDEEHEPLVLDEPVLRTRRDEEYVSLLGREAFALEVENATALKDDVDLVVLVRLLAVGLRGDELVDLDLETGRAVDRLESAGRKLAPNAAEMSATHEREPTTIAAVGQESAEVVVIGGGAMGASAAYHLTELGITDIVLIERDTLGSGSTSRSAGGIRAHFADALNIRIALRSLAEFETFGERFGVDIAFERCGYLFLLDNAVDVERFRVALALQAAHGVRSRELTAAEAAEIVPQIEIEGILGATYCPLAGRATPEAVVAGYAAAARARGARILQREAVERIDVRAGAIESVATQRRRVATDTVVCTAGVWTRDVAALAGLEVPVEGERRSIFFTPEAPGLPERVPLTIDFTTSFYFHREGPGLAFGGREQTLEELAVPATRRLPLLADLPIQSSWWGYYEMSPDHNAIVGESTGPRRFLYATGFSGHGFQQSPAVGEHLAELVSGREPTLDLSPFSLDRFERGEVREEQFVI